MMVKEMTRSECIGLISANRLGRLACSKDDRPYIIPVYYALDGNCLYSFSMPGQKVDWMRENPHVCVEVDEFQGGFGWRSVVVYGKYQEFPDTDQWHHQRLHAWSILERHVDWWEPGALKPMPQPMASASPHLFYGIDIVEVTGRMAVSGDN
ncbi:pyridoxamine 5'-phosphate oxidase family protein [Rhizobium herbae]|uniref:Pyridoxamine 5'-phosphate oxidase family protein n=1 Tax=Rhizobium herbae TaxID=508661 RepID=A0ABS7H7T2_9HYPH|nr:pyridoxamine 5'-phosphate oxidase family protein [Rhizobium herbae]MBW9062323.1 pyridoxamine 5'-phosphate oxidase family protein [Rhizobium herbae]